MLYLGPPHLNRADTDELKKVFVKYASIQKNGEAFMTSEDFVRKFLGLFTDIGFNDESVRLLAGIADTNKDGLISFAEFQAFEGLLCTPDALYKTAFQLFDRKGNGSVSYAEFLEVIQKTELHSKIPFTLDGPFLKHYFGKNKQRLNNYAEFTQLLHDFHEEYAVEAFRSKDPACSGYISPLDFQDIMVEVKRHLLTSDVKDNLVAITEGHKVSFAYFMAFVSLLNNMEIIKRIYLFITEGSLVDSVTKDKLLYAAQRMSHVTPLEIDILFQLTGALRQTRSIVYKDLSNIAPEQYTKHITSSLADISTRHDPNDRSAFIQIMESLYRLTLGTLAGGLGAFVVYPIDLVKTRMQNQRIHLDTGERMYNHSFDCFRKVIRNEGILGLYRGLLPQLMGVAPEKAIKLTVNDFVRGKFTTKEGVLPKHGEIFAGACAGTCQVFFSCPVDIVKIRLQVAGESGKRVYASSVVRELGIFGLYQGARACFLRDMPFSAIYFPTYAHTKAMLADENGYNHPLTLLAAGAIAGIPAASLVTPADVIKTRLQVVALTGQTKYNGVFDAMHKIMVEEGPRAFWKGVAARVIRSSPQFGVTLVTYELLQRIFYIDFGNSKPSGSERKSTSKQIDDVHRFNPDHIGGYHAAVPVLYGMETKFGLCLPRFGISTASKRSR